MAQINYSIRNPESGYLDDSGTYVSFFLKMIRISSATISLLLLVWIFPTRLYDRFFNCCQVLKRLDCGRSLLNWIPPHPDFLNGDFDLTELVFIELFQCLLYIGIFHTKLQENIRTIVIFNHLNLRIKLQPPGRCRALIYRVGCFLFFSLIFEF